MTRKWWLRLFQKKNSRLAAPFTEWGAGADSHGRDWRRHGRVRRRQQRRTRLPRNKAAAAGQTGCSAPASFTHTTPVIDSRISRGPRAPCVSPNGKSL